MYNSISSTASYGRVHAAAAARAAPGNCCRQMPVVSGVWLPEPAEIVSVLAAAGGLDETRQAFLQKTAAEDPARAGIMLDSMVEKARDQAPHGPGPAKGEAIPADVRLLDPSSGAAVELADLLSAGRPLVLNFGSCS